MTVASLGFQTILHCSYHQQNDMNLNVSRMCLNNQCMLFILFVGLSILLLEHCITYLYDKTQKMSIVLSQKMFDRFLVRFILIKIKLFLTVLRIFSFAETLEWDWKEKKSVIILLYI